MLERSSCIGFTFILIISIISSGSLIYETDGYELIDVGEGNQIITGYINGQEAPLIFLSFEHENELVRQNSTLKTSITFVNLCFDIIWLVQMVLIPDWEEEICGHYYNITPVYFQNISHLKWLGDEYFQYQDIPEVTEILSIPHEVHVPENVSLDTHKFQMELVYCILPDYYWSESYGGSVFPLITSGQAFEIEVFEKDTDGDGYGDSEDMFPLDPVEHQDSDLDGVGDVEDIFDSDPTEWSDKDGDGIGDNRDIFPKDPLEWSDLEGDGTGDNRDAFPKDPSACRDYDGDGHSDYWNPLMGPENSTLGLTLDMYQIDPTRWNHGNEDEGEISTTPYIVVGLTLVFIEILVILVLSSKKKKEIRVRRFGK